MVYMIQRITTDLDMGKRGGRGGGVVIRVNALLLKNQH